MQLQLSKADQGVVKHTFDMHSRSPHPCSRKRMVATVSYILYEILFYLTVLGIAFLIVSPTQTTITNGNHISQLNIYCAYIRSRQNKHNHFMYHISNTKINTATTFPIPTPKQI